MPYNPNAIWSGKQKPKPEEKPPEEQPVHQLAIEKRMPPEEKKAEPEVRKLLPDGKQAVAAESGGRKKAIIITIAAVLVLAAGTLYYFLRPGPASSASIAFSDPGQVLVGDPFPLSVSYANDSQNPIDNVALYLTLPSGISFAGQDPTQRVSQVVIGKLQPGQSGSSTFNLIVTGNPGSVIHPAAKLAYGAEGSPAAQFESDVQADVLVDKLAVQVMVDAPATIWSGQNFNATLTYMNNAAHALEDAKIGVQYPAGFVFQKSSVPPSTAQDNQWDLGALPAGATGTIRIAGSLVGQDNALYSLGANVTVTADGKDYAIASPAANLAIAASPLSINGTLNGSANYIVKPGDTLQYTFTYLNNSSTTFQNVQITAAFTGQLFDFRALQSNGSFNSSNGTVTWYPANQPDLLAVAPGQSGSVALTVPVKGSFPIRFFGDKNFTLAAHVKIQSATVPAGSTANGTISVMDLKNKIQGTVALDSAGYYHEPKSAGVSNSGPYPPRVDHTTLYTIHWRIANYAVDVQNITVSATLQSGTACTGFATSTIPSSTPTCDPASGALSWQIPFLAANTGVAGKPAEAIIQIKDTPAVNQVGNVVTLVSPASLTATDVFTGSAISASSPAVDTALPEDPSAGTGNGQVTE